MILSLVSMTRVSSFSVPPGFFFGLVPPEILGPILVVPRAKLVTTAPISPRLLNTPPLAAQGLRNRAKEGGGGGGGKDTGTERGERHRENKRDDRMGKGHDDDFNQERRGIGDQVECTFQNNQVNEERSKGKTTCIQEWMFSVLFAMKFAVIECHVQVCSTVSHKIWMWWMKIKIWWFHLFWKQRKAVISTRNRF